MTRFAFALALPLAVMLIGCSKVENPALKSLPNASIPQGWKYFIGEGGFTLAAPANWTTDPNAYMLSTMGLDDEPSVPPENLGPGMKALAEQTEKNLNEEKARLDEKHKEQGIGLMLYDKGTRPIPGEERTRIYVRVRDAKGALTEEANDVKKGMSDGKNAVEEKTVTLPIGTAVALRGNVTTVGGDVVTDIIYVLVSKDKTYLINFTSTNSSERISSVSNPIMQTFRIQ